MDRKNFNEIKDSLYHHKCNVIQTIAEQIENVDARFERYLEELNWCKSPIGRIYRKRFQLVSFVMMLVAIYCALIYGAVFGAAVCSKGTRGQCCNVGYIPGLKYTATNKAIY